LCEEYGLRTWAVSSTTTWQTTLRNARRFGKGKLGEGVAFVYPEPGKIPDSWVSQALANDTNRPKSITQNRFGGRTPSATTATKAKPETF